MDTNTSTQHSDVLLKPPDVAKRLGVHKDTVLDWLRTGQLPGIRLPRNAGWRVRESALDAWLASKERGVP